jgi:hypothetical protein
MLSSEIKSKYIILEFLLATLAPAHQNAILILAECISKPIFFLDQGFGSRYGGSTTIADF